MVSLMQISSHHPAPGMPCEERGNRPIIAIGHPVKPMPGIPLDLWSPVAEMSLFKEKLALDICEHPMNSFQHYHSMAAKGKMLESVRASNTPKMNGQSWSSTHCVWLPQSRPAAAQPAFSEPYQPMKRAQSDGQTQCLARQSSTDAPFRQGSSETRERAARRCSNVSRIMHEEKSNDSNVQRPAPLDTLWPSYAAHFQQHNAQRQRGTSKENSVIMKDAHRDDWDRPNLSSQRPANSKLSTFLPLQPSSWPHRRGSASSATRPIDNFAGFGKISVVRSGSGNAKQV